MPTYHREKALSLKESASPLCQNLCVLSDPEKSTISFGIVHKSFANVVTVSADGGNVLVQRQVVVKEPSGRGNTMVMQMKYCQFPGKAFMVMACQRGIQVYDSDGSALVHWYSLVLPVLAQDAASVAADDVSGAFARGIACFGEDMLCIGTDTGNILLFHIPTGTNDITLKKSLTGHKAPISCLFSVDNLLASGDDDGNVFVWENDGNIKCTASVKGCGFPCSGVCIWKNVLVAAYGSGHLRIFSVTTGHMYGEVMAHARWITALDVAQKSGLILSVSEDSFARVWQLKAGDTPGIDHVASEHVQDVSLCGGCFTNPYGTSFAVTGYDLTEVICYSTKEA